MPPHYGHQGFGNGPQHPQPYMGSNPQQPTTPGQPGGGAHVGPGSQGPNTDATSPAPTQQSPAASQGGGTTTADTPPQVNLTMIVVSIVWSVA